jgi:hypothetical protein
MEFKHFKEIFMRKILCVLIAGILSAQFAFADDMEMNSKACGKIAKACSDAGYTRDKDSDKRFWFDCMKPTILGKTVTGVTVDSAVVKTCLKDKVEKLKKELKEFEKASEKKSS